MDPDAPRAVDLRDYVTFDVDAPVGRRVFSTDVLAVDLLCLEPRQVIAARTFPTADAWYCVIGGRAWVVTHDAEVTLESLQGVLVPAGVPHAVRNDSPDPLIVQVVTSPPDEAPAPPSGPVAVASESRRSSVVDRLRRGLGG